MEIQARQIATPSYELNLKLTHAEAQVFNELLQAISGSPDGPRGLFDKILNELERLGVDYTECGQGNYNFPDKWPT